MKLPLTLPRSRPAPHNVEGLAFDCELAARIRDGDRTAFDRLVERHLPRVNRYLQHRLGLGHDELALSVASSTFEEALHKLGPYARKTATTPMEFWLLRLAERNLARQHHPPKAKASEPPTTTPTEGDDLPTVRTAMQTLPRRYSSVLTLALFEGMTAESIAFALGMSQARAMRRLRAALRQIGKRLVAQSEGDS